MGDLFILISINIAGLIGIYFVLKARIKKSLEIDGLLAEARKEVRLLSIEINETTDRNVSLVEDRLAALRELLSEADRRMGVFQRETGKRQDERELYTRLGRKTPQPAPGTVQVGLFEGGGVAEDPAGKVTRVQELQPAQGSSRPGSAPSEPVRLPLARPVPELAQARVSVIPEKSLRERALELYRGGFSADLIAARVGATVSEIELLISLEEGRREAPGADDRAGDILTMRSKP